MPEKRIPGMKTRRYSGIRYHPLSTKIITAMLAKDNKVILILDLLCAFFIHMAGYGRKGRS
jgi:hypothetical protein